MNKLLATGYCVLLFFFLFFSYLFVDPGLFYMKSLYTGFFSQNRLITTILYTLFICTSFLLYFAVLKSVKTGKLHLKQIVILILATIIILLFSYPAILSFDIFNYIATAKVSFLYHENPYLVMPIEFINDPILLFMHAPNKIALYGPLWIFLTSIPHYLDFNNFLLTLVNFKIFISLFYIATVLMIWKISKNIFSVALFALNPLVVIETLVSSHNDIVMMFFALVAFYFMFKKKLILSTFFLIASILIKYSTIFLVPTFLYVLFTHSRNKKINEDKVFLFAAICMFIIFIFSFLREEIYSWYAIWFLAFTSLIPERKILTAFSISLSFGLMLRYIPFMLLGTYFGPTPILKILLMIIPPILFTTFAIVKKHKSLRL